MVCTRVLLFLDLYLLTGGPLSFIIINQITEVYTPVTNKENGKTRWVGGWVTGKDRRIFLRYPGGFLSKDRSFYGLFTIRVRKDT